MDANWQAAPGDRIEPSQPMKARNPQERLSSKWQEVPWQLRKARERNLQGESTAKPQRKGLRARCVGKRRGTLKSGKGGKGGTVKSRKQAIAIGLSEARKKGAKVPSKKA